MTKINYKTFLNTLNYKDQIFMINYNIYNPHKNNSLIQIYNNNNNNNKINKILPLKKTFHQYKNKIYQNLYKIRIKINKMSSR
jgi:hypothetical protein